MFLFPNSEYHYTSEHNSHSQNHIRISLRKTKSWKTEVVQTSVFSKSHFLQNQILRTIKQGKYTNNKLSCFKDLKSKFFHCPFLWRYIIAPFRALQNIVMNKHLYTCLRRKIFYIQKSTRQKQNHIFR